jgi:hypothetical protein
LASWFCCCWLPGQRLPRLAREPRSRRNRTRSTSTLDDLSRAFHLNPTPFLSEYEQELLMQDESASITDEKSVPDLTWATGPLGNCTREFSGADQKEKK